MVETNVPVDQVNSNVEPSVQPVPQPSQKLPLPVIIVFLILLLIVGAGAYYLGSQSASSQQPDTTPDPVIDDFEPVPTLTPEEDTIEPTDTTTSVEKITIPADWKAFSGTDQDFGFTSTMSMPPGYTFTFSGSEWSIFENGNAPELWDFKTSVWREDGKVTNHYSGQSRRDWYQDFLSGKYMEDKPEGFEPGIISGVTEHKLGSSSYLVVTVTGGSQARYSGAEKETHYLYVQNGILHIIRPASEEAASANAKIPQFIPTMFTSLSSKMI